MTDVAKQIGGVPQNAPLPGGMEQDNRRSQNNKRLRIISGRWLADLQTHLVEHFVNIRREQLGKPDLSTNMLQNVLGQLCALYSGGTSATNPEGSDQQKADFLTAVEGSGWWSMAPENQRSVLAMREGFVRPSIEEDGRMLCRIVTPGVIEATASASDPDIPSMLIEARMRTVRDKQVWTWDYYDVRDPSDPTCKILMPREGATDRDPEDLTQELLGAPQSGADYPYRWTQGDRAGQPFIPHATYHARRTGRLWNSYDWLEVIEGTLTMAVLWTFWMHNVKDASWSQRWALNAFLRGLGDQGDLHSGRQSVVTDPATIMQFASDGDNASLGQFTPSVDPKTLGEALRDYEQRVGCYMGLAPSDYERGGQAESGYAISLKRESVREAQRSYAPLFRRGDAELIGKWAAMYNRTHGTAVPEDGWELEYAGLPYTAEEVASRLGSLQSQQTLGVASKVDMYLALHPGTTRETAMDALMRIREENARLG